MTKLSKVQQVTLDELMNIVRDYSEQALLYGSLEETITLEGPKRAVIISIRTENRSNDID